MVATKEEILMNGDIVQTEWSEMTSMEGGSDWMSINLWPLVQDTYKIHNIIFPASHNSATTHCQGFGSQWAKCQTLSIRQQLEQGIRFFDFRISDDLHIINCGPTVGTNNKSTPNKGASTVLWVTHVYRAIRLDIVLGDIYTFSQQHGQEIIGIRIEKDYDRHLSSKGIEELDRLLFKKFKDKIINAASAKELTIRQLIDKGLNILLCPRGDNLNLPLTFGGDKSKPCNILTSWMHTKTSNPEAVISRCTRYLQIEHGKIPQDQGATLTMLEVIVTPSKRTIAKNAFSSLRSLSQSLQGDLSTNRDFFRKVVEHSYNRRVCNIISSDFVDAKVVKLIISMNIILASIHRRNKNYPPEPATLINSLSVSSTETTTSEGIDSNSSSL